MKQFYTYLHCKPDGTPFYVGKGHDKRAFLIKRNNSGHKKIVNKYGKENIKVFVFPCENEDQALDDEMHQILQLRQSGCDLVNTTLGGRGATGYRHTNESKEIIRKYAKEHYLKRTIKLEEYQRGKPKSDETKRKIAQAQLGVPKGPMHENTRRGLYLANFGKPLSEEHRNKVAKALIGNKNPLGKKRSPETIAKMRIAATLREKKKRESK